MSRKGSGTVIIVFLLISDDVPVSFEHLCSKLSAASDFVTKIQKRFSCDQHLLLGISDPIH